MRTRDRREADHTVVVDDSKREIVENEDRKVILLSLKTLKPWADENAFSPYTVEVRELCN